MALGGTRLSGAIRADTMNGMRRTAVIGSVLSVLALMWGWAVAAEPNETGEARSNRRQTQLIAQLPDGDDVENMAHGERGNATQLRFPSRGKHFRQRQIADEAKGHTNGQ